VYRPQSGGNACKFDRDTFSDLSAEANWLSTDSEVTDSKSTGGRDLHDQALDHAWRPPYNMHTVGNIESMRCFPPRQIDVIHVQPDGVEQRNQRSGTRQRVDCTPNRWIAVAVRTTVAGTADQGLGFDQGASSPITSQHCRICAQKDLGDQRVRRGA